MSREQLEGVEDVGCHRRSIDNKWNKNSKVNTRLALSDVVLSRGGASLQVVRWISSQKRKKDTVNKVCLR